MIKSGVWTAVDKDTLKLTDKVLTTTWAMKKKPNGNYRARINARGFKQLDGLHYNSSATSSPVTNDTTIRIIFTLAMLAGWKGYVIDVKGAFLNARFDKGEELFLKVPQGFEQFYKESQVLKLNRTIYGLKQAAQAFWTELLRALMAMGFVRRDGDPCCYYKNVSGRKIICLSWVEDCIFFGSIPDIIREKNKMMEYFECEDVGFVKEYVGCKVEMSEKERSVKFTQPFLVKSLVNEFGAGFKRVSTPAPAGQCLQSGSAEDVISESEKKKYQAGVGKLLYLTRWSRPEIGNLVRELSKFSSKPQICHQSAMKRVKFGKKLMRKMK
jgi:Reverse transcriptase (RNA-dependent DNA polymerase)